MPDRVGGKLVSMSDKRNSVQSSGVMETMRTVGYALLIALIIRALLFQPFSIPSGSMLSTLLIGDYLFVSKYAYGYSKHSLPFSPPLFSGRILGGEPERGDVAVFKLPTDGKIDYIKRVIGLPGEEVQIRQGQVLIDGQDLRRVTLESLRAEAVVVCGDEPVFNTTVLENITVGQSDLTKQDAIEACKVAHAESFIRQLPKGYETHLGHQDSLLDAGQRFRLSLARAIARNPALLIIQEPVAALDAETKAILDDTYQRICNGRTMIFLPSRLSTVKKCDRIVVLHHGRVASDGRHEDLVRSSELYRHWEYMRFNVFR